MDIFTFAEVWFWISVIASPPFPMIAPAAIEGTSILKCTLPENRMSDMLQVYFDNVNLKNIQDYPSATLMTENKFNDDLETF